MTIYELEKIAGVSRKVLKKERGWIKVSIDTKQGKRPRTAYLKQVSGIFYVYYESGNKNHKYKKLSDCKQEEIIL